MKVIIAGSRTIKPTNLEIDLAVQRSGFEVTLVLSGGCNGVDKAGELWAKDNGIPVMFFHADWDQFGKKAGPIRNQSMADNADALILIWDGVSKGSSDMKRRAENKNIPIFEVKKMI